MCATDPSSCDPSDLKKNRATGCWPGSPISDETCLSNPLNALSPKRTRCPWAASAEPFLFARCLWKRVAFRQRNEVLLALLEVEVDHWRNVERQNLRDDQTAHYGDAERLARFGARAPPDSDRQGAKNRRHGR